MGLQDKLLNNGSVYSNYNGADPEIENKKQSKLHKEYSINGEPVLKHLPEPSSLDLQGQVPFYNYKDNAPAEGIGRI